MSGLSAKKAGLALLGGACLLVMAVPQRLVAQSANAPATPRAILDSSGRPIGLFERVVSRPGATLLDQPAGAPSGAALGPFTTYYVYTDQTIQGAVYYQVGPNSNQPPTGWLAADATIDWPNNLTLAFNEPVNRDLVLFFENPAGTGYLMADPGKVDSRSSDLLQRAQANQLTPLDGVVGTESSDFVHWSDRFYLMPVLDFVMPKAATSSQSGGYAAPVMVETAAIPVNANDASLSPSCAGSGHAAIVFVLDTTTSMQPYIDETLVMIEGIVSSIQSSNLSGRVSFGLVGFRDRPQPGADVQYLTHVYQPLDEQADPNNFPAVLRGVQAAAEPTMGIAEDGLRGLLEAENLDWAPYSSRWIIYVSDASMRTPITDDKGNKHDVRSIASSLWESKKIALTTIYLNTPDAARSGDAGRAEAQFKTMTVGPKKSLPYLSIPDGDPASFGGAIDARTQEIINQLDQPTADLQTASAGANPIAELGLAQRMVWLGECEGNSPPDVARGWIADPAIGPNVDKSRNLRAFEPRILLTKVQMNQLAEALSAVRQAGGARGAAPEDFFQQIGGILGIAIADPNQVQTTGGGGTQPGQIAGRYQKLGDFLPNYLSRTPYRSDFLTISQADWVGMSAQERSRWLDRIDVAISALHIYYNRPDTELKALHPAADRSEWVYPVLLADLP